jgi:hypothetical protein
MCCPTTSEQRPREGLLKSATGRHPEGHGVGIRTGVKSSVPAILRWVFLTTLLSPKKGPLIRSLMHRFVLVVGDRPLVCLEPLYKAVCGLLRHRISCRRSRGIVASANPRWRLAGTAGLLLAAMRRDACTRGHWRQMLAARSRESSMVAMRQGHGHGQRMHIPRPPTGPATAGWRLSLQLAGMRSGARPTILRPCCAV